MKKFLSLLALGAVASGEIHAQRGRVVSRPSSDHAVFAAALAEMKTRLPGPLAVALQSSEGRHLGSSEFANVPELATAAGVRSVDLTAALRNCAGASGPRASMATGHEIPCSFPGAKSVIAFLEPPAYSGERAGVLLKWWSDTKQPSKRPSPQEGAIMTTGSETWYVTLSHDGGVWRVVDVDLGIRR
jgi:hypothetical protein